MSYSASEFGRYLTSLCESRGLSPRRTLKEVFGMDGSNLQKWRNDESMPRADLILAVAEYFDVSTDFLYGRKAENEPETARDLAPEEKRVIALLRQADDKQRRAALRVLEALLTTEEGADV